MISVNLILSRASITRIVEVFDEENDLTEPENPLSVTASADIVFENVCFAYGQDGNKDEEVLSDINLEIKAGETVGIIGGTGSGKSTLVQLIPRLYDVTSGRVLVGGVDVREQSLGELRDKVAMVLQKNLLFSGTIADNLRWGNKNATQAEIEDACRSAAAHDFISELPDGYQTMLGQGGVNLSGGQKQRLCIARALLKKPAIIILDDSTSAVDTATDSKIRRALAENLSDTTAIIVAQRISSVMDADKIVVLDDGRINAVGTHAELLAGNRIYQEVYYSQQKGGGENA
jgi:ATP-binding cassette subfamily B protein